MFIAGKDMVDAEDMENTMEVEYDMEVVNTMEDIKDQDGIITGMKQVRIPVQESKEKGFN